MTAKSAGNSHFNHIQKDFDLEIFCVLDRDAWDRIKVGFMGFGQTVRSIKNGGLTWRVFFVLNMLQNTEMEGCLHKNNPFKINIKLVRVS